MADETRGRDRSIATVEIAMAGLETSVNDAQNVSWKDFGEIEPVTGIIKQLISLGTGIIVDFKNLANQVKGRIPAMPNFIQTVAPFQLAGTVEPISGLVVDKPHGRTLAMGRTTGTVNGILADLVCRNSGILSSRLSTETLQSLRR